jgi:hypothetical protein
MVTRGDMETTMRQCGDTDDSAAAAWSVNNRPERSER